MLIKYTKKANTVCYIRHKKKYYFKKIKVAIKFLLLSITDSYSIGFFMSRFFCFVCLLHCLLSRADEVKKSGILWVIIQGCWNHKLKNAYSTTESIAFECVFDIDSHIGNGHVYFQDAQFHCILITDY